MSIATAKDIHPQDWQPESIGDTFEGAIMPARLADDERATVRPKESAA